MADEEPALTPEDDAATHSAVEPVPAEPEAPAAPVAHRHGPIFLLDGSNIAYRAFFALPDTIATSTGFPTNALYGFASMVIKILGEYHPETVVVAWDARERTFRREEYEEYKAQRKPMPDLLSEQWPHFEELGEAFGFVNLKVPGYEADDILATLATQADAEGRLAVIVTGDRDALQLVTDHVTVMSNTRGITEVKLYDPAAVVEKWGIPPRLVPDLIGLKGDTSDNIPGIPGIGEKTAAQLLAQFGTLEGVLDHIDEVKGEKRRELLREHRETAILSKRLATAVRDVPIDIHGATLAPTPADRDRLRELFTRFEFSSLAGRLNDALPADVGEGVAEEPTVSEREARTILPAELEKALDWTRTIGLAAAGDRLWLGQAAAGSEAGPGAAGHRDAGADRAGGTLLELVDPAAMAGPLRALLARGPRVCHHYKAMRPLHALLDRPVHDTFIAAYLLAPGERSYALADLALAVGRARLAGKDDVVAGDALVVLEVASRQEAELRAQGMWGLLQEIELPLTGVLLAMERDGIHLDCYLLGEITMKLQDQMEGLQTEICELAGGEFNLGSPQQLGQVLFERLGLPRQRKIKTGYSTDAKTLEALKASHPIVEKILQHRELSKLMSTYLLALPQVVDAETGRLHTTFHQAVAATGRLSSSDPNLQNIPVRTELGAQIRECFTAEPGNLLVVADYSQIELRLMAHLSQEPTLLAAFREGQDIHTRTAAEVFELDESAVDTAHRRYAKAVNFGIMYGISSFGLASNLGIEREVAAAYIQRYFERMPRVRAFIDVTIADARMQGWVTTLFGRRRPIPELRSDNFQTRALGERLAVNSILQGTAADIIKVAMIRCHERLRVECPEARLVLQVHDELIAEAPAAIAERVRDLMVTEMVGAFAMDPPLEVDTGIGGDWLAAK